MTGNRRVGLLVVPANNTTMEREKTGLSPRHGSAWPDHRERHGDGEQRPPPNAP